jgi:hypothetical protein
MATIRKEVEIRSLPERVWEALRDVGALHRRLAAGWLGSLRFVVDAKVTSPTAGCRRLLLTRPAREGPVQPLGGYARRARLPVRCVRTRRNETPLV